MLNYIRKGSAVALALLVLFFTTISILAIWELINIDRILFKSVGTLMVIFTSSAVLLFIFSVLFKSETSKQ